jgi:aminoglycoside phosphotransferase (APT) family kinase protein
MHAGELELDAGLVRRLLAEQFPRWAGLPLRPVASAGTDNALYRLGTRLAVRLPRVEWAAGQVEKDLRWLPRLAAQLPLQVPQPLAVGQPAAGYPWTWAVYRWLPGQTASLENLTDACQAARDLAHFLTCLQQSDPTGGPLAVEHGLRGASLSLRDAETRQAIAAMQGLLDTSAATRLWESALQAPEWGRPPVWFHGDLLKGNLLARRGRLSAVIDFSGLGVGDPACDLMIAWSLFSGESRAVLRAELGLDEATWRRGQGMALSQAVIFIPYYLHTNPLGVAYASHMLAELLADPVGGG